MTITPEIREFLKEPKLLIMTKAAVRSRVHRRVHLDYIGVKRFDPDGKLVGECVFCGLLTSTAYTRSVRAIPYLRRKVDRVISRAGFDPASHSGKALVNVLEHYPRDELFQIDEDTLYHFALAILQLDERPRVRVLPRRDRFDRFVSVLVYIPRDRYDSQIRAKIGDYLATAFKGRVRAFYPFFPEGPMVRVHFIIGRYEGETPIVDRATLDRAVEAIVRSWIDGLRRALRRPRTGGRACFVRPLSRRLPGRLPRGLSAGGGGRRYRRRRGADRRAPARRRALPQLSRRTGQRRAESLQPQPPDPALRARAGAGEYGFPRRRRAHLPHPAA